MFLGYHIWRYMVFTCPKLVILIFIIQMKCCPLFLLLSIFSQPISNLWTDTLRLCKYPTIHKNFSPRFNIHLWFLAELNKFYCDDDKNHTFLNPAHLLHLPVGPWTCFSTICMNVCAIGEVSWIPIFSLEIIIREQVQCTVLITILSF